MKKVVFIFAFIAGVSVSGIAQQNGNNGNKDQHKGVKGQQNASTQGKQSSAEHKMTPEQKAAKLTQYMTTNLNLTTDQQTKVSALNISKAKQLDSIRTTYKGDMEAAKAAAKTVKVDYNNSLNTILTSDQKTKWEALKKQKKEEFQKNKAAGTAPKEGDLTPEDVE